MEPPAAADGAEAAVVLTTEGAVAAAVDLVERQELAQLHCSLQAQPGLHFAQHLLLVL